MGIITYKISPASPASTASTYVLPGQNVTNPTYGLLYNWVAQNNQLGDYDIGRVWTDYPGAFSGEFTLFQKPDQAQTTQGSTGALSGAQQPNPVFAPLPGQIVSAWEPTLGWGEFILLRVPSTYNTAIPVGTAVTWDATYSATILAAKGTSQKTGQPVAISVSTCQISANSPYPITPYYDGSGIPASPNTQYFAWFQVSGRAWTLKTAVQVTPNAGVYVSGTAGRVYATSSAGGGILGARAAASTTTSTQSLVLVAYNVRAVLEGA